MNDPNSRRRTRRWAVLCMLLAGAILIWMGCGTPVGRAAEPGPKALVERTTAEVLASLRDHASELDAHPERIYAIAAEVIVPHFDFERMSALALGRLWRTTTPEQRERFVAEFRTLLVRVYATALLRVHTGQVRIETLSVRGNPTKGRVTVRTQVVYGGAPPLHIDYKMRLRGDAWKVYDLAVDGVALVTTYRSDFAAKARRLGIDGLIAELQRHNARSSPEG